MFIAVELNTLINGVPVRPQYFRGDTIHDTLNGVTAAGYRVSDCIFYEVPNELFIDNIVSAQHNLNIWMSRNEKPEYPEARGILRAENNFLRLYQVWPDVVEKMIKIEWQKTYDDTMEYSRCTQTS